MITIKHIKRLVDIFYYYTTSRCFAYDVDQSKQISIQFKRESPQNGDFVSVCYLMQGSNNTRDITLDAFFCLICWNILPMCFGFLNTWCFAACNRKFLFKKVGLLRNKNNKASCVVHFPVDLVEFNAQT